MTRFRSSLARIAGAALLASVAAGCRGNNTPSDLNVPFNVTDITVGTGIEVVAGATLVTDYIGWLYDPGVPDQKGLQFDNSLTSPNFFIFVMGENNLIPGFTRGFEGMKVGGVRRVEIPPDLAYGAFGSGLVPPNATLIFQIYLYDVLVPE
jgi:FKBP-type peptidyl-prolyl cis-trans isomerase